MGALALAFLLLAVMLPASNALLIDDHPSHCTSVCESAHCHNPFELRYGKYCGPGYTGCPGEAPCDPVDACCQQHDNCVGPHNEHLLTVHCTRQLRNCVEQVPDNAASFPYNNCSMSDVKDLIDEIADIFLVGRAETTSLPPWFITFCLTSALLFVL